MHTHARTDTPSPAPPPPPFGSISSRLNFARRAFSKPMWPIVALFLCVRAICAHTSIEHKSTFELELILSSYYTGSTIHSKEQGSSTPSYDIAKAKLNVSTHFLHITTKIIKHNTSITRFATGGRREHYLGLNFCNSFQNGRHFGARAEGEIPLIKRAGFWRAGSWRAI